MNSASRGDSGTPACGSLEPTAPNHLRLRLSAMMFLHYFIMGSWFVVLATFLLSEPSEGGLNFTASQNAWIHATLAIAGLIAPPLLGLLADRLFAAQRLMAFLYLAGAMLMGSAALWCHHRQSIIAAAADPRPAIDETFLPLFLLLQLYAFVNLTTGPLTAVVALRNLPVPQKQFARVRLVGTIGWIVAGFVVALAINPISPAPMFLAAGASLVMGLYCLSLPHTPPKGAGGSLGQMLGLPALSMLRDRGFAVFLICAFGLAAVQAFYTLYANKFLTDLDAPAPAAVQTLSQWSEVLCMMIMPWALMKLGVKRLMMIGILGWAIRNALFATESTVWVVGLALPMHGLCFTFFFLVAIQYVDHQAPPDLRASAQGIYAFTVWGAGTLAGNWVGALVKDHFSDGVITQWGPLWMSACWASLAILAVFTLLFRAPSLPAEASEHKRSPTGEDEDGRFPQSGQPSSRSISYNTDESDNAVPQLSNR